MEKIRVRGRERRRGDLGYVVRCARLGRWRDASRVREPIAVGPDGANHHRHGADLRCSDRAEPAHLHGARIAGSIPRAIGRDVDEDDFSLRNGWIEVIYRVERVDLDDLRLEARRADAPAERGERELVYGG